MSTDGKFFYSPKVASHYSVDRLNGFIEHNPAADVPDARTWPTRCRSNTEVDKWAGGGVAIERVMLTT